MEIFKAKKYELDECPREVESIKSKRTKALHVSTTKVCLTKIWNSFERRWKQENKKRKT